MRAAAYNKPCNKLAPSPISSPDSFILTVPRPLPVTLTAAKDTQARGAQAHDAWVQAQAPNRNRPAAAGWPGTHPPRRIAPNRPSFLIHCPELEIELSYTKQNLAFTSNRQFFAVLKLPDTLLRVSPRHAERLRHARPTSRKSPRTAANGERLIGNDMHSPARATTVQCATSIFLIGNEFRFAECEFSAHFRATAKAASSRRTPKKKSPTLTNRAWGNPANEEQYLRRSGPACPPRRASAGRLKPRQRALLILLPIAHFIRANGFGLHEFCHSLFDLSLAAASSVSQLSVSLLRFCQGTASAVPKDKTDAILPIVYPERFREGRASPARTVSASMDLDSIFAFDFRFSSFDLRVSFSDFRPFGG